MLRPAHAPRLRVGDAGLDDVQGDARPGSATPAGLRPSFPGRGPTLHRSAAGGPAGSGAAPLPTPAASLAVDNVLGIPYVFPSKHGARKVGRAPQGLWRGPGRGGRTPRDAKTSVQAASDSKARLKCRTLRVAHPRVGKVVRTRLARCAWCGRRPGAAARWPCRVCRGGRPAWPGLPLPPPPLGCAETCFRNPFRTPLPLAGKQAVQAVRGGHRQPTALPRPRRQVPLTSHRPRGPPGPGPAIAPTEAPGGREAARAAGGGRGPAGFLQ